MSSPETAPWRHLLAQAERCLAAGDRTGAEVHLTAAIERARRLAEPRAQAEALLGLARLRRTQRRDLAADALLDEAEAALGDDDPPALREAIRAERTRRGTPQSP